MEIGQPVMQVLSGQVPSRYPIWFLRQAGRYLPEYQKIRRSLSFVELCQSPDLAAEVTLQPLKRFDLDAAIIFSDILIPAMHLGQDLRFDKGHGPVLSPPIRTLQDLKKLKDPSCLMEAAYVGEAISLVRAQAPKSVSVLGFAGAPVTVASYMIEGGGAKHYYELNKAQQDGGQVFAELIERLTQATFVYLQMQIDAGADALVLFDTWAGQISVDAFERWALPSLRQIFNWAEERGVPLLYYPGQGWHQFQNLVSLPPKGIALDWRFAWKDFSLLAQAHPSLVVQGNLNPAVLTSTDRGYVEAEVLKVLQSVKDAGFTKRHIFNVGHGLTPQTSVDALNWVIQTVRSYQV